MRAFLGVCALSILAGDATRRICISPFAEDAGQALHFCGYDGLFVDNRTAWIYRAAMATSAEIK